MQASLDHFMFRVGNLDKEISFLSNVFDMSLSSKQDYPEGKFTLAFLTLKHTDTRIELTYNWDKSTNYEKGDMFGHIAFIVKDINAVCSLAKANGAIITRKPGPMKHGTTVLAFLSSPNGINIELIEK